MAAATASAAADTTATDKRIELGRQIYLRGVLPSGQAVRARVQGDVAAQGAQLVCAGCHGRSGLGVGEGQVFMPPVTGTKLYEPQEIRRKQLYAARTLRPAYTDESLARAIRAGVDSSGRPLDAMMPHYVLGDDDLELLISYLKSLSSTISPGVTATDIHFATVLTEDIAPQKRKAMLDVLEAFFGAKNAETRHETSRAARGPFHMAWHYQAYRKWNLHVWELNGPADTWPAQLEAHYARQPVFAVVGGIGRGPWRPMHEFCERQQVPCLLPDTELPVVSETDYYSLYFSKGMTLEAQVLAKHLSAEATATPVMQVYRNTERGMAVASVFRQALRDHGSADLHDRVVDSSAPLTRAFWQTLLQGRPNAVVALWLDDRDLPELDVLAAIGATQRIYVSATLLGDRLRTIPPDLRGTLYAVHPFDLPQDAARRLRVLDAWMRNKNIALTDARVQANTLFTVTLVAQALKHVGSNFQRDYFIERIEHIFDSMVTPSAYPQLGLGPNQRYAAKGSYIVRLAAGANGEPLPVGGWIVP
jgi:ABC-type branched-subunit amino acid transport system substrate-binding protein/mono/diheme cytochrome c family protein